jgi:GTP pyrophosphokinase
MDCKNYLKSIENTEEAGRWVRVTWANTEADVYSTALFITIRERSGIVMDVATVLNGLKIKKTSLSAKDLGEVTTVSIVIEVKNLDELNLAVARLSSIPGAIEIKRGNG